MTAPAITPTSIAQVTRFAQAEALAQLLADPQFQYHTGDQLRRARDARAAELMMDVAQADGIGNATNLMQAATLRQRGDLGKDRKAANRRLRGELGTDRTTANVALRQGMLGDLQAELRPFQQRSKQQQFADEQFALNEPDLARTQANTRLLLSNARAAAERGVITRRTIPSRSIRTPVRKAPTKMPAYHITPTGRRITMAAHKRNVARGKALAKARNGGAFAARGNRPRAASPRPAPSSSGVASWGLVSRPR